MSIYQFKITKFFSKEFILTLKTLGDSIIRRNNLLRFHFIFILGIALWMPLSAGFPDKVLLTYLSTYFTYSSKYPLNFSLVICSLFSLLFLKTYRFMFYVCVYICIYVFNTVFHSVFAIFTCNMYISCNFVRGGP